MILVSNHVSLSVANQLTVCHKDNYRSHVSNRALVQYLLLARATYLAGAQRSGLICYNAQDL